VALFHDPKGGFRYDIVAKNVKAAWRGSEKPSSTARARCHTHRPSKVVRQNYATGNSYREFYWRGPNGADFDSYHIVQTYHPANGGLFHRHEVIAA